MGEDRLNLNLRLPKLLISGVLFWLPVDCL